MTFVSHSSPSSDVSMSLFDKSYGAFQGLAIGDALGAPVEFKLPGEFTPVTDYESTHHFQLPPGYWTDDTSMALALADALIENNGYNSRAVLNNYCDWYLTGKYSSIGRCFDIGYQTQDSLRRYLGLQQNDFNSVNNGSAGNAPIMRLAPLVISTMNIDTDDAFLLFGASAYDTHPDDIAVRYTAIFGLVLRSLLNGSTASEALALIPYYDTNFDMSVWTNLEEHIDNTGYIVTTFLTAWWAFTTTTTFEEAVLKAANLGGDADTIAAVTGQLAGAYYGQQSFPVHLVTGLHQSEIFEPLTHRLLENAT